MRRFFLFIAGAIAWLVSASVAQAYIGLCCAKCGGNMPMNIPGGGVPETYEFRIKVQPIFMTMPGLMQETAKIAPEAILGMPAMGYYMAAPERMEMRMLNLAIGYSASPEWFVGAMAMWMDKKMPMRFNAMMRAMTAQAGFSMRSRGFADLMLMAKRLLWADDRLVPSKELSLFLGLSVPTGSITKRNTTHPVPARRQELLPYPMQLGSGTWDPAIGLLWQQAASPWWWGIDLRYTHRLGKNRQGWAFGDRARIDAYLMHQPRYNFVLYAELGGELQQRLRGEANEAKAGLSGHATIGDPNSPYTTPLWDPKNSGHRLLSATIGLQWQPKPMWIVDLGISLPIWQRVSGIQMRRGASVMLTIYSEVPTEKSIRSLARTPEDAELGF